MVRGRKPAVDNPTLAAFKARAIELCAEMERYSFDTGTFMLNAAELRGMWKAAWLLGATDVSSWLEKLVSKIDPDSTTLKKPVMSERVDVVDEEIERFTHWTHSDGLFSDTDYPDEASATAALANQLDPNVYPVRVDTTRTTIKRLNRG